MFFDTDFLNEGSIAWVGCYLAGSVIFTAWARRADFRQRGRPRLLAVLDVLGTVCLTIPALAYWRQAIAVRLGDGVLGVLLGLGLASTLGFVIHDARTAMRHPTLPLRLRRRFALVGIAAALAAASLEVWWGGSALLHIYAAAETLPKTGV